MNVTVIIAMIGSLVTISGFVGGIIYKMGHQSARIEELERWRSSIRVDMHEISNDLKNVGEELKRLATVIEERTARFRGGGSSH